ncbi:MAG: ATP-dependent metallopeptidase FtsH/Yme1/Tma family protein [Planctomycetota bacterium]|nr:MAG: ATP-dependent metallopeptidase FtsH/Yme1/Tma family protein [Planctomycetota bacterium]
MAGPQEPMSDKNAPGPGKPGKSSRKDKGQGQSNSGFWYLLVIGILAAVFITVAGRGTGGEEISYSEFLNRLETGTLNKDCMFEVSMGSSAIYWQDKAADDIRQGKVASVKRFYTPLTWITENNRAKLEDLLHSKGVVLNSAKPPSELTSMIPMLLVTALFILGFIFVLRRVGGAGSAMSFGRSRGRLYAQEDVNVTFNDVAGIDEAVEELKEVVEFLKTPQKYQALGGRIPRGVLLVGPPGTGKTMLAKAVAGEAGVPFFGLSGSDFVEMYVGVGAARVRDMFQQALQRAPAIIFIDELDALGKVRGSGAPGGHDEREQTLNALLVEMDGFSTDQSVIVMGATNRPETLDPALMRPGRFDRHVLVDRPDIKGREAILNVHSKRVKMADDVDLKRLAKLTPGFVGADLANLVNEAALLSARREDKRVTMRSFEAGIERVMAGLEKTSRIIVEDVKRRVACHESGHALVAASLPHTDPVHKISIIPRGMGALGYMLQLPEDDRELLTQSELQSRMAVLLGGISAEQLIYNETSTGASNDLQRATDLARRMVTEFGMSPRLGRMYYSEAQRSPFLAGSGGIVSESIHSEATLREIDIEVKRLVDEAYRTALDTLTSQRETLEKLTADLIEMETMSAEHMHKVIDANRKGPKLMAIAGAIVELPAEARVEVEAADGELVLPPREVAEG